MYTAQKTRKENIAEYILYLWQLEDLLRALQFSPEANLCETREAARTSRRAETGSFPLVYGYREPAARGGQGTAGPPRTHAAPDRRPEQPAQPADGPAGGGRIPPALRAGGARTPGAQGKTQRPGDQRRRTLFPRALLGRAAAHPGSGKTRRCRQRLRHQSPSRSR